MADSSYQIDLGNNKFTLLDKGDYEVLKNLSWYCHEGYAAHKQYLGGGRYTNG